MSDRGRRELGVTRIMLASTGGPFPDAAIERTAELCRAVGPPVVVVVLSVARIWGTALGLPHPGLYPTRREWGEQEERVRSAARALAARGLDVRTRVVAARNAPKAIAHWAAHLRCDAIVVPDPQAPRWRRLIEGSPSREIGRRTDLPVHPVATLVAAR